ncbi:MAG: triose-phosphate isomerase [Terriglobia bacterium]
MRRPVIAGNWKMFKTAGETRTFFDKFKPLVAEVNHCEIVIAPPFTALSAAVEAAQGSPIAIGAQNLHWEKQGAFTGEVAPGMLTSAGCAYVLIGHSERRQFFGETDETVSRKLAAALEAGLTPIVCVGERLAEREDKATEAVLARQFAGAFSSLTASQFSRIIVAYEPVWAIGTGKTATPEMAAEAHRFLRRQAEERFSPAEAKKLRILYGGSVKPGNVQGLMAQPEIDGALVGGASLDAESFAAIVKF